ncbi:MAG TPA: phospholipase D-like domain-containing protein [Saprospiraceae bacterium]|nr:phospholipase D-like domain-containing protein [Saprospiraceae bacterium]HPI05009.1 phospholipase D-like domain-containing protein [Saprospiraceae bacterium]
MRYKSSKQGGYTIYAVAGLDVISFAIDFTGADTKGLLGFAVERHDLTENEKYFMKGFKVFQDVFPDPAENVLVSTNEHPVQSFVWDDFTAKPEHEYDYYFYPVKGNPKFLQREKPVLLKVKTEKIFSELPEQHDVFFNRGVASSQEYARRFFNLPPDKIEDSKLQQEAYDWLTRKLREAFYKYIDRAKAGDSLFGCFYEFHFEEAVARFKAAIDRGVNVTLIIDCKNNGKDTVDKKTGKTKSTASFPKEANLEALSNCGIDVDGKNIIRRTARKNDIAHNKFLIYQPKSSAVPTEVWTGSTNISQGGMFGQTNVGHWIRNAETAQYYKTYWDLLATDPGAKEGSKNTRIENSTFKTAVDAISGNKTAAEIMSGADGITPIFSPRTGPEMLETYFELVDKAKSSACITLAFGVNKELKTKLLDNTYKNSVIFMMLEKKDEAKSTDKNKDAFVELNARNNVYAAYGSFINDPLNKWVRETNTQQMGLNSHVMYIHTKFLLHDPLSGSPVIVTGSANFSGPSTEENDENMVIIKGNLRAADIYFTEFNRLFNHYYFRSVLLDLKDQGKTPDDSQLFLDPTDSWLDKYKPGKLRRKRVQMFIDMEGVEKLVSAT